MSDLSKKIMEKLDSESVAMIPRWKFTIKRMIIWVALFLAVITGAFSLSMIMFHVTNIDWELLPRAVSGTPLRALKFIPYFWLLISVVLFALVYFDFRKTEKGYKYRSAWVIGGSVLLAFMLAIVIHLLNAPSLTDVFLRKEFPIYSRMNDNRKLWHSPERGLLAGRVIQVKPSRDFILRDPNGFLWDIDCSKLNSNGKKEIKLRDEVRVLGELLSPGWFLAHEIRMAKGKQFFKAE